MDALAAHNEEKAKLEAGESELQLSWQAKEHDFRARQCDYAQERERKAKALEQVRHHYQLLTEANQICSLTCRELCPLL